MYRSKQTFNNVCLLRFSFIDRTSENNKNTLFYKECIKIIKTTKTNHCYICFTPRNQPWHLVQPTMALGATNRSI